LFDKETIVLDAFVIISLQKKSFTSFLKKEFIRKALDPPLFETVWEVLIKPPLFKNGYIFE
jgi:hypothetical protein